MTDLAKAKERIARRSLLEYIELIRMARLLVIAIEEGYSCADIGD